MKDVNLFGLKDSVYLREVSSKAGVLADLDCDGFLIRSSEGEARKIIASLKDKKFGGKIGFVGGDDALNRRAVESLKIDYLVSPEGGKKVDSLKQRDSGLNHVLARIAKEKGVGIVVDMGEVRKLKGKELALGLERIMQNVLVCRKVGCRVLIGSFAKNKKGVVDEKGRRAFGVSLGMSSKESFEAVKF